MPLARRFACFTVVLLAIITVACEKPAENVDIVSDHGTLAALHLIPEKGGIIQWQTVDQQFWIAPSTSWPATCKDNGKTGKDKIVTCKFKPIGPGEWQEWRYKILPESSHTGVTSGPGGSPTQTLRVGHCQNCSTLKNFHPHDFTDSPSAEVNVTCGGNAPTVDQPTVPAKVGDVIEWEVSGTNPEVQMTFDPGTCSSISTNPPSGGASEIECTVAQSGYYTVGAWQACHNGASSGKFRIQVSSLQH